MSQILTIAANSAPWRSLSSVSGLWNSLTANQWAAVVATFVLTIGVVLEYWHQLKLLAFLSTKWLLRKATPFEVCALRKLLLHTLGPILVVVGISGEVIFEGRTFILENRQERASQATVSFLNDSASTSEAKTAQLQKESAQLAKNAEDEHLARVELEDSVAWRRISLDKRPAIAARLRSYGGQLAWLTYNITNVEANDFGVDIAGTLKLAHWIPTEPEALMKMFEGPVNLETSRLPRGVVVTSTPDSLSERAAKALVQELVNAGFDATSGPLVPLGRTPWEAVGQDVVRANGGNPPNKRPTVFVSVEPRPDGPQGDAKLRAEAKKRQTNTAKTN